MQNREIRTEIKDVKKFDSLRPSEGRVLLWICELFSHTFPNPDQNQTDIATKLKTDFPSLKNLKIGTVNKLVTSYLQQARRWGILNVFVNYPQHNQHETKLKSMLVASGITNVYVASAEGFTATTRLAAKILSNELSDGKTIIVDGGKTVRGALEMSPPSPSPLKFIPICSDPPTYELSALNTITRLSTHFPNSSRVLIPLKNHHPFNKTLKDMHAKARKAATNADIVLLGTGSFSPNNTAFNFVDQLGLSTKQLQASLGGRVNAMCGYFPLDSHGRLVLIEKLEQTICRAIEFKSLCDRVKANKCTSYLLASGAEKADAVRTAIRAGLCNAVIIDLRLAESIIHRMNHDVIRLPVEKADEESSR